MTLDQALLDLVLVLVVLGRLEVDARRAQREREALSDQLALSRRHARPGGRREYDPEETSE